MLSRCAVGHLISGFSAGKKGIMSLWLEERRRAGAEGREVVGAERERLIPWDFSTAFFPNKELEKNPIQVSLSMKYSPAGGSDMTVVLSLCNEQSLDEVANC